jgi:hypothetical protein
MTNPVLGAAIDEAIARLAVLKLEHRLAYDAEDPADLDALAALALAAAAAVDPLFAAIAKEGDVATDREPYDDVAGVSVSENLAVELTMAADEQRACLEERKQPDPDQLYEAWKDRQMEAGE